MKRIAQIILLFLVIALMFIPTRGVLGIAAESAFTPQPIEDIIDAAVALLASLVGFPAVAAAVIALLEYFKVIAPENSDDILIYANIGAFVAAFIAVLLGLTHVLSAIDYYLSGIAPILVAILAFLTGGTFSTIQTKRHLSQLRSLRPYQAKIAAEG